MFIVMRSQIDFLFFSGASNESYVKYKHSQRGPAAWPISCRAAEKQKNDSMAQVIINMAPLRGLGRASPGAFVLAVPG